MIYKIDYLSLFWILMDFFFCVASFYNFRAKEHAIWTFSWKLNLSVERERRKVVGNWQNQTPKIKTNKQ